MSHFDDTPTHHPPPERPRYRVPIGIPTRDEGRRAGALVSIAIHALVIGLLIIPFFLPSSVIRRMQSGGGAGPAGGGGGGSQGTGGEMTRETLRFVKLAPNPVPTPKVIPPVPTPVVPKPATPAVKPPVTPPVVPPKASATPTPPATGSAPSPGAGGGTGADGTAGTGPGSGGGVGSGVGTGNGSAIGPGTGGGPRPNHDPQPVAFFLPPLPAPESVRGFQFVAQFDIDSTGRVLDFKFTPTPDGDYNNRLASVLRATRFRPGTRPDGTPIRATAQIIYGF